MFDSVINNNMNQKKLQVIHLLVNNTEIDTNTGTGTGTGTILVQQII